MRSSRQVDVHEESFTQGTTFVIPYEKKVEQRNNGALKLRAAAGVDGGRGKGLSDGRFTDVGNGERDIRTKTVIFLKELIEGNHNGCRLFTSARGAMRLLDFLQETRACSRPQSEPPLPPPPLTLTDYLHSFRLALTRPTRPPFFCPYPAKRPFSSPCGPSGRFTYFISFLSGSPHP